MYLALTLLSLYYITLVPPRNPPFMALVLKRSGFLPLPLERKILRHRDGLTCLLQPQCLLHGRFRTPLNEKNHRCIHLAHFSPQSPVPLLALLFPLALIAFQHTLYLLILFIASCFLLNCELRRQEFLSVVFTAVALTPRTEPSTWLGVKKFKEGMNPDPKGTHNRRERGLHNIYLQKSNWAIRLYWSFSEPDFYD